MGLVKLLHDLLLLVLMLTSMAVGLGGLSLIAMIRQRKRQKRLETLIEEQAMAGLKERDNT